MHTITRVIGTAAMTAALGLGVSALPASAATPASAPVSVSMSNQSWWDSHNDHNRCDRFDPWGHKWDNHNWWNRCDNRDHRNRW
ncbi:hypothetical protein E5206_07925 [Arthrobacter sp. PAMC25564]|uniref:hypothetical protein n=1 Tax=Arthrobacter sp. PAMC25564 TaxID=2565366 RepID=UPI0010A273AC|nr:hypothetical protein [Arthrobacter sp. PAMC25564]QCB96866.1 hypothetical protein E5206_07925 [Arthrobacter sp. PAMC25564]